ncbi:MAG: DUF1566 domain-containing protein [Desulfobulbaceae bacterium]|nr:DUF1566 domain-containing protein [Desulfobulbaceae bacterium]
MKKRVLSFMGFVLILGLAADASAFQWPDTGQTKRYDNSQEIGCPEPGEPFYGQDADYAGPDPGGQKFDADGNELLWDAAEWAILLHSGTGLMWEMKTNDGTIHDRDNKYTWCDTNPETNGGYAGTCGNGTDTEDFIQALNDAQFGGYNDWRLPTIKELSTLVDADMVGNTIDLDKFPDNQAYYYWSSSTYAASTGNAWNVYFGYGYVNYYSKLNSFYVRAVRGGQ